MGCPAVFETFSRAARSWSLFSASHWAPELKRVDWLAAEWAEDIELRVSEDGDINWKGAL